MTGRRAGLVIVIGAWFVSSTVTAAGVPAPLSSPDRGVVCDRVGGACFDRYGPSIGLTEAFLGSRAAERLIITVRTRSAHVGTGPAFSVAPGVVCVSQVGPCRSDGEVHPGLTAAMYGPWPPRARSVEVAAVVGADWQWVATQYSNDTAARPRDSTRYLLRLEQNGFVHLRADCNEAWGAYRMEESRITIDITHAADAPCGSVSLGRVFLRDLSAAGGFFLRHGRLYLDLPYETGTMEFQRS